MAEHIQRKTDKDTANIPLWFGEPAKDTFTLANYTAKVNAAQTLLALNETTAFQYFERSLRGSALSWLHTWLIKNRDSPREWTTVKSAFRQNFGDSTSAATFAQDIYASNLATFQGDFHKFYAHIARLVELHCEPFIAARIELGDNHGFTNAQQRRVTQIVTKTYRNVHDKLTIEFFLNGLPKAMFEKVATKPELVKPSQIIEYLKKCDTVARKDTIVRPPPLQHPQPTPATFVSPVNDQQVDANVTCTNNGQNRGSFRGRYNNARGRGNYNSARGQTSSYNNQNRKPNLCIYCRKPNHDQEKCNSRIRDNQPCLSPKGVPYWPKNVSAAAPPSNTNEEEQQTTFSVFHNEVL